MRMWDGSKGWGGMGWDGRTKSSHTGIFKPSKFILYTLRTENDERTTEDKREEKRVGASDSLINL